MTVESVRSALRVRGIRKLIAHLKLLPTRAMLGEQNHRVGQLPCRRRSRRVRC
jgi:hypothetical protein